MKSVDCYTIKLFLYKRYKHIFSIPHSNDNLLTPNLFPYIACSKVFRSDRGVISSPIEDNLCPSKAACIFEIQLDPGSKIKLTFTSLSLLSDESLTIKNGSRVSGDIPRNVSSIASENLLEYGNAVFLNLSCSSSFFNRGRGFSLQYYDNQGELFST